MGASLCFGEVKNLGSHEGFWMGPLAYVAEVLVSRAHSAACPLMSPVPLGALKPRVRLFLVQPSEVTQARVPVWAEGAESSWLVPWRGAAVSAENLKPIIKSTVSQSAVYYPHAGHSKQRQ